MNVGIIITLKLYQTGYLTRSNGSSYRVTPEHTGNRRVQHTYIDTVGYSRLPPRLSVRDADTFIGTS
jgi:hypothetical protein